MLNWDSKVAETVLQVKISSGPTYIKHACCVTSCASMCLCAKTVHMALSYQPHTSDSWGELEACPPSPTLLRAFPLLAVFSLHLAILCCSPTLRKFPCPTKIHKNIASFIHFLNNYIVILKMFTVSLTFLNSFHTFFLANSYAYYFSSQLSLFGFEQFFFRTIFSTASSAAP